MSNEITIFDDKQLDTIKNMYCKGLSDEEITVFMHICQRTKLDPFAKQIYAIPRWDAKLGKNIMTVQTGIDGYRLIAERTGKYSPGKEPIFTYNEQSNIVSCTAFVKKMTPDGIWHEVAATAFWNEYCQRTKEGKPTSFWFKMPHGQLSKCAEALALRKAFPGDLSGIYTKEEMEQADIEVSDYPKKEPKDEIQQIGVHPTLAKMMVSVPNEDKSPQIDHELARQLMNLSKKCDPDYVKKVMAYLVTKGIEGFINLTEREYKKVKIGLEKNSEIYKPAQV